MIRKLNAVAVAALALVAAAGAQAQSSVSIYGVVDQALASVHNSVDAEKNNAAEDRLTGVEDGGMTSSYIGFSGTEDLGGGLKALFKLETYVKGDTGVTGTSNFWGRNSWLGPPGDPLGVPLPRHRRGHGHGHRQRGRPAGLRRHRA